MWRARDCPALLIGLPIYAEQREILQQRLFAAIGVPYLDLELLLNMKPDDEFKTDQTNILSKLETFIKNSKRFVLVKQLILAAFKY